MAYRRQIKVEPYWNVKEGKAITSSGHIPIKVEPYWNVKIVVGQKYTYTVKIKVEPYWNVKSFSLRSAFFMYALK